LNYGAGDGSDDDDDFKDPFLYRPLVRKENCWWVPVPTYRSTLVVKQKLLTGARKFRSLLYP
jgi:hypothetical protein